MRGSGHGVATILDGGGRDVSNIYPNVVRV